MGPDSQFFLTLPADRLKILEVGLILRRTSAKCGCSGHSLASRGNSFLDYQNPISVSGSIFAWGGELSFL